MAGTLRQAMVFLGLADDGYEPQRDQDGRPREDRTGDRRASGETGVHDVVETEFVEESARTGRRGSDRSGDVRETAALQDFAAFETDEPRSGRTRPSGEVLEHEPVGSHAAEAPRPGRDLEPVRRGPARSAEQAPVREDREARGASRRGERRAEQETARRGTAPREEARAQETREDGFRAPVTPINRAAAQIESDNELRRITTIHPRSYNDAKAIGESFRENIPVIMNVTDMDVAEAKRLVDFSSGLTFALNGSIERVTEQVFLLTPANLEVLGAEETETGARQEPGLPVFNQD